MGERPIRMPRNNTNRVGERGLTLVELIVTFTILAILATAAFPIVHYQVRRIQERQLKQDLYAMRRAIDRYKTAADLSLFQVKLDSQGYPPELKDLTKSIEIQGHKVKFLSKIPVDPITNSSEWGMRSMQDDPTSDSFSGPSVYDVYSKSTDTALDGTKYSDW